MLSISFGPVALPVSPLLLMLAVWLAGSLAGRLAPVDLRARAENAVWLACALGLLVARVAYVLRHATAYLTTPLDMLDLRDGGWLVAAGLPAGLLWLAWRGWQWPSARRALVLAAATGIALWAAGQALLTLAGASAAAPQVPEVMLTDARTGQVRSLPQVLAGRPTVVNLWASWCGPCRVEMPVLAAAQQRESDIGFVFVNQGESSTAVLAYLQRSNLGLHNVWIDAGSALGPASGSRGLPTTLFFDAQGRRVDAHFGIINAAALQARLAALRHMD